MDEYKRKEELVSNEDYRKKIHQMVDEIDNTWLLNQIIKLMINLKK